MAPKKYNIWGASQDAGYNLAKNLPLWNVFESMYPGMNFSHEGIAKNQPVVDPDKPMGFAEPNYYYNPDMANGGKDSAGNPTLGYNQDISSPTAKPYTAVEGMENASPGGSREAMANYFGSVPNQESPYSWINTHPDLPLNGYIPTAGYEQQGRDVNAPVGGVVQNDYEDYAGVNPGQYETPNIPNIPTMPDIPSMPDLPSPPPLPEVSVPGYDPDRDGPPEAGIVSSLSVKPKTNPVAQTTQATSTYTPQWGYTGGDKNWNALPYIQKYHVGQTLVDTSDKKNWPTWKKTAEQLYPWSTQPHVIYGPERGTQSQTDAARQSTRESTEKANWLMTNKLAMDKYNTAKANSSLVPTTNSVPAQTQQGQSNLQDQLRNTLRNTPRQNTEYTFTGQKQPSVIGTMPTRRA